MSRVVIKFKDGTYINVLADTLELKKGMVMAWSDDRLVAVVKTKDVISCHMSEQK